MSASCCCDEMKHSSDSHPRADASRRCSAVTIIGRILLVASVASLCACLAILEVHRSRQTAELSRQVDTLQQRIAALEDKPGAPSSRPLRFRRFRREVDAAGPLRTIDGIPIVDERPYGQRPRPQSEGLRIYETFGARGAAQPTAASVVVEDEQPTAPPINYVVDDPSILPHHRSSAAFRPASRYGRVNTNAVIAEDEYRPAAAAVAAALRAAPPGGAPGELHRKSRSAPVLEARGAPPEVARPPSEPRPSRRSHCSAAHFQAEVSSISRKSSTYGGNGRLRNTNPDALFTEWREADWMEVQRCGSDFRLYGGQVTVRQAGLYMVYAQINYLEDSDINGFEIQVNARPLVKCITMEASDQQEKTNTCYTGAVTYLNAGDAVSIRDLEPMRHAILLPDRSFFGLVRFSE